MNSLLKQSLLPLTHKLNKYLINIIDQYNYIDFEKLITYQPKEYEATNFILNKDLTIEDIIIKSIQRGYGGFYICKNYTFLVDPINKMLNKNINKIDVFKSHTYQYTFKNDKRNHLSIIDILKLENVVLKIDHLLPIE